MRRLAACLSAAAKGEESVRHIDIDPLRPSLGGGRRRRRRTKNTNICVRTHTDACRRAKEERTCNFGSTASSLDYSFWGSDYREVRSCSELQLLASMTESSFC